MPPTGPVPPPSSSAGPERFDADRIEVVLCDLDGVIWLDHRPIAGSPDAVGRLRASGRRVLFVTNNSVATRAQQEAALADVGIQATGDVVSSAMAAASLVEAGERVLVAGGPGVVEAVEGRDAVAIPNDGTLHDEIDAVVVGLDRDVDYARLRSAGRAILAGARLIGTNGDTTFPTPDGLDPGGGALLAAIATIGGVDAVIAGKPHLPMADLVVATAGIDRPAQANRPGVGERVLMVGDRPGTDGLFAERLGAPFALVRSGVTAPHDRPGDGPRPAIDAPDLAAVADLLAP